MSKYRFKTEEEFKRDGIGIWLKNYPDSWTSSGSMNKYIGQDIPDEYSRFCDVNKNFDYQGWFILGNSYVLKEIQSEYTVGKWYGCKDWSSPDDFIKLERVYDDQAYFRECLNDGNYQKGRRNWWTFVPSSLFEADMSIVSPLLPDGHPDKITAEETSFVLPKKWCIKLTEENVDTLGEWRDSGYLVGNKKYYIEQGFYLHTPKHGVNGYGPATKDLDYEEITFEQFKQHVLKESSVVESPKEIDMKDIQEEAKKRFPIGCKFIPVEGVTTYTLIEDGCTYEINGKHIYAHDMHGFLYKDGRWATLVSSPETKEESIPEYVECIEEAPYKSYGTLGKIYKVQNWNYSKTDCLLEGSTSGSTSRKRFKPSIKEAYEAQNTSELTPLEICKQKYKKGMRVMSADKEGIYSGEFTIEVDPDKFTKTGCGVDYFCSQGWLYVGGDYAEILDETAYVGVYDPYQIEEVKKETFIENIQSVDVEIYRKKKIRIF